MVRRTFGWAVAGSLCLAVLAGCAGGGSGKPVKTSGVLLWEDGTPVEDANVVFVPMDTKGMSASALTNKDGTFDLTTKTTGDGAAKGEYKIVVTLPDIVEGLPPSKPGEDPTKAMQEWAKRKGDMAKKGPRKPVPVMYTTADKTPLKATIESAGQKIELKLRKT